MYISRIEMGEEMGHGRRKPIYFAVLVLLFAGLAWSTAGMGSVERAEDAAASRENTITEEMVSSRGNVKTEETVSFRGNVKTEETVPSRGNVKTEEMVPFRGIVETEETADSTEQADCQKASRPPGEKHAENGAQGAGEKGRSQSSAVLLDVTDFRVNNPTVKEYADKETFLRECGFDGQEPYFEYFTEDGALQLELYYDKFFGVGCGLRYYPGEDLGPEGFLFNGSRNYRYYGDFLKSGGIETDPYSVKSFDGGDGKGDVEDYEESVIYREDGRPARYVSQGWVKYLTEKREITKILQIEWFYREDGTLQRKDYWHNGMVFGTWYSSRQSYYDEQERLVYEHCYVTHGSVDYYYIYEGENETPAYCLVIDHNMNLLCAELLEYHGAGAEIYGTEPEAHGTEAAGQGAGQENNGPETEIYYGRIGPMLAGESENRYAEAVLQAAEKEGKDYSDYVTHTYAADYDGDSREEAFVICGREIRDKFECDIAGDCWFVNSDLEVSRCIERAYAFDMSQEFICQDGITYLLIRYSIGLPWQAEIYTVRDNAPVETSDSCADKYIDRQGQVIQIENAYDGNCMRVSVGEAQGEDNWRYLWTGHSWKPYTFWFDHGKLREVPAREVTREEVERIAPLPDSFAERATGDIKQFILRDNGELNINITEEFGDADGEWDINFSYITYRLDEAGQWEYVEQQMGYYEIQFSGGSRWDYIEALYQR